MVDRVGHRPPETGLQQHWEDAAVAIDRYAHAWDQHHLKPGHAHLTPHYERAGRKVSITRSDYQHTASMHRSALRQQTDRALGIDRGFGISR